MDSCHGHGRSRATSVTLSPAPTGWAVGDEIVIAPTEAPTAGTRSYLGFNQATITSVSGATIGFNTPTANAHPQVNGQWDAEVMDLTRNVRIEGTATGHSRVFISSTKPQSILYTTIRYMGPRQVKAGAPTQVLGRYGLHFHMAGDGSRGSLVQGTVVRDTGAHAFVPHMSNGITFRDDVSYATLTTPTGGDGAPITHTEACARMTCSLILDIAPLARRPPKSQASETATPGPGSCSASAKANAIKDSTAVGIQGSIKRRGSSGLRAARERARMGCGTSGPGTSPTTTRTTESSPGRTPSNPTTWATSSTTTTPAPGILPGAYENVYQYHDDIFYGNGAISRDQVTNPSAQVSLAAQSSDTGLPSPRMTFANLTIDAAGISDYAVRDWENSINHFQPVSSATRR